MIAITTSNSIKVNPQVLALRNRGDEILPCETTFMRFGCKSADDSFRAGFRMLKLSKKRRAWGSPMNMRQAPRALSGWTRQGLQLILESDLWTRRQSHPDT